MCSQLASDCAAAVSLSSTDSERCRKPARRTSAGGAMRKSAYRDGSPRVVNRLSPMINDIIKMPLMILKQRIDKYVHILVDRHRGRITEQKETCDAQTFAIQFFLPFQGQNAHHRANNQCKPLISHDFYA
ncbi:TPA: hypothetical protein VDA67_001542 [Burkholderia vietnamiensis]|nr:hypothetical protein [Burkholderia vietnamiensis]HEP6283215.1 hypothetical protein [Burkholderia vietnamiensis]HEP6308514.1 hypothetical protein [Burkholderia vietnamiensis]